MSNAKRVAFNIFEFERLHFSEPQPTRRAEQNRAPDTRVKIEREKPGKLFLCGDSFYLAVIAELLQ
jgi:hypothetical protein